METQTNGHDNRYPAARLNGFAQAVFAAMGCTDEHAHMAAQNLVAADLRGIDSHGVARLSGYYRLYEAGRLRGKADYRFIYETPGTATLDADAGLGLVAGQLAMEKAIEKAKTVGTGWVAVQNSNHFGIAGRYALMAAAEGMIGFATTNASPLVAPTHGRERMLGTNPLAFAIPAGKYHPFVADMATTTAANGKLEILQRKRQDAPKGWIQTADGQPSQDPSELSKGGALLPLGSFVETASHKGFALGAVADILSGVLSGASFGPWAPPFVAFLPVLDGQPGKGLGHLFGAIRVDAFRPKDDFLQAMDTWIEAFSQTAPLQEDQRVIIPGQPEFAAEEERRNLGIPLLPPVVQDLEQLGAALGIAF
jgi:LDH2 family malate/lactate/ureidoglycolate dehydrogenase